MNALIPVIMCGGSGTRLWPASRETMPKQFIPLFGEVSTFQATAARFKGDPRFAAPIVIAHEDFRFVVGEQLRAVGVEARIVLEPSRRDSAAAVAVATLLGLREGEDTTLVVMASDHLIPDAAAFRDACAAAAARPDLVMTLGLKPTDAKTAYGYIRPAAVSAEPVAVAAFVEKPDRATAERYVADGYLWNSGNFVFSARTMCEELARHAPAVLEAARGALEGAERDLDFLRLGRDPFLQAPKISIDFAVMEKTDRAGVLAVDFAWSDIGGWDAVWEHMPHDADGNAVHGDVVVQDARNCLVRSDGVLTAVVGVENAVVVATGDAVLVTTRDRAGEVKQLVAGLQAQGREEATQHRRMYRPWGWYQRVDLGPRFQVKRIMVKPGGVLSLQKHFHRAEHWVVVHGTAEVTRNNEIHIVQENESIYLPLGCVHRMSNPGRIPLHLIEVQVGSYTGEDDIVRIDDAYGR